MSQKRELKRSIEKAMKPYIHQSISSSRRSTRYVSDKTIFDRWKFYGRIPDILFEHGFGLRKIENMDRRHIAVIVGSWERRGLAAGTMQTYVSMLRVLCRAIGKESLLDKPGEYFDEPDNYHRVSNADVSKNWDDAGVDALELINEIQAFDNVVSLQMHLMDALGLRLKEAWLLRPAKDWRSDELHISHGPKNGRFRIVPVANEHQRRILGIACGMAKANGGSMIPEEYSLERWRSWYYHVMNKFGVTKGQRGITSHGLRHGHLQRKYLELLGREAPVRDPDGRDRYDRESEVGARMQVAEIAGHSRVSVTNAYLGYLSGVRTSNGRAPRKPSRTSGGRRTRRRVVSAVQEQVLSQ
jgi:integrase